MSRGDGRLGDAEGLHPSVCHMDQQRRSEIACTVLRLAR